MDRSRMGLIAVAAAVAAAAAFLVLRDDGDGSQGSAADTCPATSAEDAAYEASFASPPRVDDTFFDLLVTRDGQPVTDATMCFIGDMPEMSHASVDGEATEVSAGTYRFDVKFSMRGTWQGEVTVVPATGSAVHIPIEFDVS
ncbi:MAG: FixH family protein [Acidimicrobiales bacterium]